MNVGIETATTAVINNCAATMERQVFESSALKEALQDAFDAGKTVTADAMDDAAKFIDEHPDVVETGTHMLMAVGGVMAGDRGTKAPKIRSKGQAKADKILAKGMASAAKPLVKGLRTAADKIRDGKLKSDSIPQVRYKRIKTPRGLASQDRIPEALEARKKVKEGATLYRGGTTGKSHAAEAQYWSLENPLNPGYAKKYGIPAENFKDLNFVETAQLKPGTPFVTRPAPGVKSNRGGAIEVVVPVNGVQMKSFHHLGK
ncbi:MAG: hypothetical protein K2W94_08685 [Alphaproteobacteria bacterium]|nr:hypothetical protein [Alphaproteobacteria bacterium]